MGQKHKKDNNITNNNNNTDTEMHENGKDKDEVVDTTQNKIMDDIEIDMKKKDDILQYFYDITSIDNESRVNAITSLITTLQELQKEFKPSDHSDISRYVPKIIEKSKVSKEELTPELNYSLRRLVMGLGSTRDSARFGFSLALSEVLHSFKQITLPWFFEYLCNFMDLTGKDLAEKESHFGRLFGIMAIVKSNRLSEFKIQQTQPTKSISYNANRPDSENMIECLVEQLLYFSKKRVIYTELSYEILMSLLDQMTDKQFETLWSFIKPIIPKSPDQYTPDLLSLILFIVKRFKSFNITKNTSGWSHQSLFNKLNINLLKNSFLETSKVHPRVHKVWKLAFDILLTSNEKDFISINDFWGFIAEENLFKSSSNRCYLGLQLLEILLPNIKPEVIKDIFLPNTAHYLCQSLKPTSPLHEIGVLAFQVIPKTAEISQKHRLAMMLYFATDGKNLFDVNVCRDILNELIKGADEESIQLYLNHLYADFYDQEKPTSKNTIEVKNTNVGTSTDKDMKDRDDEDIHLEVEEIFEEENYGQLVDSHRIWVLNQISYLTREVTKKKELLVKLEPAILNLLKFIFFHSYFQPTENPIASNGKKNSNTKVDKFTEELYKKKALPELSQSVREACFARFCSTMEELSVITLQDQSKSPVDGTMSNGEFWSNKIVNFQLDLMVNPSAQKPTLVTFISQGYKPLEKLGKSIKAIQVLEKPTPQLRGFELLFLQISLQYLAEPAEMSEIIEDILVAYEELINPPQKKKPTNGKGSKKEDSKEKPAPFMVILDILISLLDQPSHFLRTVIKQIFSIFSESVSFQVLEHILTMIKAPTEELFQDHQDDDEEDDDLKPFKPEDTEKEEDEEEEEEEDDEMEVDENQEDDEDEEDEDEDSDNDEYVDPEFVKKLKEKLGDHLLNSDDEDDGATMPTAKQAQSLNNTLSSLMGSKTEKKKANHYDIKTKTINLKIRLLDLLETYIKKFSQKPTSYIFKMVPLMIDACQCDEPAISNRFISLFKNKFSMIRSANEAEVKPSDLNELLATLFDNLLLSTQSKPKSEQNQKKKKNNKIDLSTLTEAEKNPFLYLLSGQALYLVIRVLISMKQQPEPVKKDSKSKKNTNSTTNVVSFDYGKINVEIFNKKLNLIIDNLTDRSNVVPTTFFTEFSSRFPSLVWLSMNRIIGLLEHVQNDFGLIKVLDYIGNLYKRRDQHTVERVTEIYPSLFKHAMEIIKSSKEKQTFKSQSLVQLLNILLTTLQIITPSQSTENIKSNISTQDLEIELLELCKSSDKQALKDISKRILKLVGLEDNKLVQIDKRKRQKKEKTKKNILEQRKEDHQQLKKETKENILKLKEERKQSSSTDKKVENKIKSRPKKKTEDGDSIIFDDDDEIKVEKEEDEDSKKPSKKKFKSTNNNSTPTTVSKKN